MTENGQPRAASDAGTILRWPGQVVSAEDLRRSLNGHHELLLPARAVITPLAAEHLRAAGIRVTRESSEAEPQLASPASWGIAQQRPHPGVSSALQALQRDGIAFQALPAPGSSSPCAWTRALAEGVSRGDCQGAVLFCDDSGLICCVANKIAGVRAAAAANVLDAARATATLGVNLLAVPLAGPTFFELRQILRTMCLARKLTCPAEIAHTLEELDGHAHR
jgi:ribose 5-phosphate isomerase RpiB